MFNRSITPIKSTSFFLFGARGTGKTTFLRSFFDPESVEYIDLLSIAEEERYMRNPAELEYRLLALHPDKKWVVIDEIQRIPRLLDSIHRLIESTSLKFALTGSSARKLRRGASNLLAGRAFVNYLHPLTLAELGDRVPLLEILKWGCLPKIFQLSENVEKQEFLRAYTHSYLREEIAAEQIVRKLEPFRNFLNAAAQSNGTIINYSRIARDVGADTKTVQAYFTILQDTLMGFLLPSWRRSFRKRQSSQPKFYFFDLGIKRALDFTVSQEMYEGSFAFGNAFEHLMVLEFMACNDYYRCDCRFSYLKTPGGAEIDLIIDHPGNRVSLVEFKSTKNITNDDCKTVNRFAAEIPDSQAYCISCDPLRKKIGSTLCINYRDAAKEILSR
jgi:predicted AAA+ superfamily ATPase